jgi:hypothetical protein
MDEFQPAPTAQQQQQGGGSLNGGGSGGNEVPVLPEDVDLEEQRMLMAAIQGGGYEGPIPGKVLRQPGMLALRGLLLRAAAAASGARSFQARHCVPTGVVVEPPPSPLARSQKKQDEGST